MAYAVLSINLSYHSYSEYSNQITHPCSNCTNYLNEFESLCKQCGFQYPVCIASGRIIYEYQSYVCPQCKHKGLESEISKWNCCPLCHLQFLAQ
ncbi:hypothetical protein HMI54_011155 [Coelomomyces lativittatus]|nr:hypothetical protein HMI54_011155 [Coelomomyces lativittatus]